MVNQLVSDFRQFNFEQSTISRWSPKDRTIYYSGLDQEVGRPALFHELGHAVLGHKHFDSDIELIQMEREAWEKARDLALKYSFKISINHIEECMDTYRNWLKSRSTCPTCNNISMQTTSAAYACFNCQTTWKVPRSQACRIRRQFS